MKKLSKSITIAFVSIEQANSATKGLAINQSGSLPFTSSSRSATFFNRFLTPSTPPSDLLNPVRPAHRPFTDRSLRAPFEAVFSEPDQRTVPLTTA
jgi:hypothetical protein